MPESIQRVLLFALIPMGATILGGVAAAFFTPGARLRSYFQHFAAGVVFAAAAGELLPDIVERHRPTDVVLGFVLGVGLMLAVRWFAERLEGAEGEGASSSVGLIAVTGVDILIDGLLIGVGFAAGAEQGFLLTIALTMEVLFLGVAVAASLGGTGVSRGRIVLTTAGLALLLALGAGVGTLALAGASNGVMEIVLAFGLVALLYLVTEELLVEAHEVAETPFATTTFFLGFLALLLVQMMGVGPGHGG